MFPLAQTDDQVMTLAMNLPTNRWRELAAKLCESGEQVRLVDEGGVLVIHAEAVGDLEAAIDNERECRISDLIVPPFSRRYSIRL